MRQIVLDTETTGLAVAAGHRLIEIGAVELINRRFTGNNFHCYVNPGRDIESGALQVHGITQEFLADKPVFTAVAEPFWNYVQQTELIIHNAEFDLAFINNELKLMRLDHPTLQQSCAVIDTLLMARQKHPGQPNNLDALCKRYQIDNSKRDFHGALLDAKLLAEVYLAMTGGQTSLFNEKAKVNFQIANNVSQIHTALERRVPLQVIHADETDLQAHQEYLAKINKLSKGKTIWKSSENASENSS